MNRTTVAQTLAGILAVMTAAGVISAGIPGARAEDAYDIGEVIVSAKPEGGDTTGQEDATGFTTVIHVEDLPSQVTTVSEVLDQSVGVSVKQYGGPGSLSTVSVRGSSADQVVVYMDGIQLNRAVSGSVNLADIPLDSVEKIEIYRGTSPAKFGASGIGGVVNIITKKQKRPWSARAAYSYGSFKTHKAHVRLGAASGAFYGSLLYSRMQSDGDFEFKDRRGTAHNRQDDRWTHRRNNDFKSDSLLVKGGCPLPGGILLDVQSNLFKKRQGVPGIGNFQSEHARLRTVRSISRIRLTKPNLLISGLDLELTGSYTYQRQKFKDPKDEIGFGRQDNRDYTRNVTGGLTISYHPGGVHTLTLLAEASRETYNPRDRLASSAAEPSTPAVSYLYGFTDSSQEALRSSARGDEQKRRSYTVSLEDELYLFHDRLLLAPSVKYNYYDNDFSGSVPFSSTPISPGADTTEDHLTRKLGVALYPASWLTIKGNVGKYYRIPNFYELFGDRGAVVGNTGLEPEDGLNWDIGFTLRGTPFPELIKTCTLEYSYFLNDVDNLIIFIQNSQRTSIARNISSAKIKGHEFYWFIRLCWPVIISGNYTIQDARDRSSVSYWRKKRLPGRPKYELFNRVEIFTDRFRLFHELEFVDECYLDRANLREIDSRTFQNAGFSWSPAEHIMLTFEVKNLSDRHSEDVAGYPLPGRSFYGTIEAKF